MNRRDFLTLAAALSARPALAGPHDFSAGLVQITHPWTRPTAAGQNAAGYFGLHNTGPGPETLLRVECLLAARVTLHESRMSRGVMGMRMLPVLAIPAGGMITLAPAGLHIMLEHIRRPFALGERIAATLVFQRAGRVAIAFAVQAATPGSGSMPGMRHKSG